MGRDTNAGRAGRGGNSGRGGRGRGGRGRGANATVPRKASEVGACKELEGHIFTIGSGNKGKDGDMLRTSMEKMTTYIRTKFGVHQFDQKNYSLTQILKLYRAFLTMHASLEYSNPIHLFEDNIAVSK
jgi:hypothetical protein